MFTHRRRLYGGVIFVAGGQLYLQGCTFIRFRPLGNPFLNSVQIGRDILIIAGNMALSGVYNLNVNLFANNVILGNILAVLGGTAVWAGGAGCHATGVQAQWGAGRSVKKGRVRGCIGRSMNGGGLVKRLRCVLILTCLLLAWRDLLCSH